MKTVNTAFRNALLKSAEGNNLGRWGSQVKHAAESGAGQHHSDVWNSRLKLLTAKNLKEEGVLT